MRRQPQRSGWPQLLPEDVVLDGWVRIYRNPAGERFRESDTFTFSAPWCNARDIPAAEREARGKEAQKAKETAFAWDPSFGYLSPDPYHAGCGLEIGALLHLEGINLLGDLDATVNAFVALRMSAMSHSEDGLRNVAHIFKVNTDAPIGISEGDLVARAQAAFSHAIDAELNARRRLVLEDPRVLEDAITRALAILRSARLLTKWELADILSPVRLAATLGFIDGIDIPEIDGYLVQQITSGEKSAPPRDIEEERARDREDAKFADLVNERFSSVRLNRRARKELY